MTESVGKSPFGMTKEELEELIRRLVREELQKRNQSPRND